MSFEGIETEIIDWHKSTFPNATKYAIEGKVTEELNEFIAVLSQCGEPEDYWNELADVIITNIAWINKTSNGEVSLSDIVRRKLEINKSREWGAETENGDRPRVRM